MENSAVLFYGKVYTNWMFELNVLIMLTITSHVGHFVETKTAPIAQSSSEKGLHEYH